MKIWKITFYGLSIFPILFSLCMLALYIQLWSHVGYAPGISGKYPYYAEISPDQLQNDLLALSMPASMPGLLGIVPLVVIYLFFNRTNISWTPVLVCISSFALALLIMQSDLLQWYLD